MASLVVAIGMQNAFVMRQGMRRESPFLVALVCTLCDVLLVTIGCLGVGALIAGNKILLHLFTWGGAAFLFCYALRSFRNAMHPQVLQTADGTVARKAVVMAALAISLLNPHAVFDTVVLVGGVSAKYMGVERLIYALGALSASALWFFALAYGAQKLAPVLARPATWRIIDIMVGIMMLAIAISLVLDGIALLTTVT